MKSNIVAVQHPSKHQHKRMRIVWNLGKRCNFQCSYCDEFTRDNFSKHLPFETAKQVIDKITSSVTNKTIRITLTGGEPTVNPDIEKILQYMNDQGIEVTMTTNGSRTAKWYRSIAHLLFGVNISYHMEYHRRYDVPEKIIALHEEMKALGTDHNLRVHAMALPGTLKELQHVADRLEPLGINIVRRRIRPAYIRDHETSEFDEQGRLIGGSTIAPPNYKGIVTLKYKGRWADYSYTDQPEYYTPQEEQELQENPANFDNVEMFRLDKNQVTKQTGNTDFLQATKDYNYKGWMCWAGTETLRINANGDVYVATCKAQKLGNIYTEFALPESHIVCPLNTCTCNADLNTSKAKNTQYAKLLRCYE